MPSKKCYPISKPKSMKNKPTTINYGPNNKPNVPTNNNSENKKLKTLLPPSTKPKKP